MNQDRRIEALLLLVLATSGCVLPDEKLGEGAEGSGDDATGTPGSSEGTADATAADSASESGSASGSATSSSTVSTSSATTGSDLPGVGAPCDHDFDGVPESALLTYPTADCEGQICLYADLAEAPQGPCTTDESCNASNPAIERFVCNTDQVCALNPSYLAQRSMCSAFCEDDSQCVTDEPTNCVYGFSCEPQASVGEACCRQVCVCNDDMDEASAAELRLDCETGQTRGCCDTLPGNGLCPD